MTGSGGTTLEDPMVAETEKSVEVGMVAATNKAAGMSEEVEAEKAMITITTAQNDETVD